ncbi:oxidoreductase [Paraburkholderia sp. MMS20-SJTR3]|uniref:Oxidoreductase n=1 Tax=Paraburkholderia sejongensis TaxID=2886946 RepID=A0ABS8JRL6_9BURK|nr:MDR family oxidoreductase [Paraburkholderia sp. MMS20-SJTR3]MCC8392497.1 oxidoreductase [Paraburkholderia sp. MMS20-SJTR3]
MPSETFNAMVLRQDDQKNTLCAVEPLGFGDLPNEDTLVKIDYSTLNFKDALAVTGKGKIVRQWPLVPGVDFAGTVVDTTHPRLAAGQRVVLTGWSVGEAWWGGYSQFQSVRGDWLVPLPEGLTTRNAMMVGTAGFTAMLCVDALEAAGVSPSSGVVLVTGAAGGVGSVAVAILSRLGYTVAALTGSDDPARHAYVVGLGASSVVDGEQWKTAARPLEGQKWAAAIDTVGSGVLARVLAEMNYGGIVAACGLAGGADLPTSVMPFILRGVRLLGVDSVMAPIEKRIRAWERLTRDLPLDVLETITQKTVRLDEVKSAAEAMLAGKLTGRVLVDVN